MTYTPEYTPPTPEAVTASDEARSMYSIDLINQWRSDEWLRLGQLRTDSIESGAIDSSYVDAYKDAIEEKLDEFLASKGITPDDAEYTAIRELYRDSSPDRYNEDKWGNSPASRGIDPNDTQSQSEKVREAVRQWHENHADSDNIEEDQDDETDKSMTEMMLEASRDQYAKEIAKDRKRFWGRFLESDNNFFSKWIKKIPAAKRVAGFVNENLTKHKNTDKARETYRGMLDKFMSENGPVLKEEAKKKADELREKLRNEADDYSVEEYNSAMAEIDAKEKASLIAKEITLATSQEALLQSDILKHQREVSGKATRFSNWWARQKGFLGKLKKGGALVGSGLVLGGAIGVAGLTFGLAVPGYLAMVAGISAGAGIGLRLNNKLANSKTSKGENAKTVAEERAENASNSYEEYIQNEELVDDNGEDLDYDARREFFADEAIDHTESETDKIVKGNRNRLKSIIAAMALGSRLGFGAVNFVHSQFVDTNPSGSGENLNPGGNGTDQNPGGNGTDSNPQGPSAENPEWNNGSNFTVESGNGYTHELKDFVEANGHSLSDQQAWDLHNELRSTFGDDYINMLDNNGSDIYYHAGDIRLSRPGTASWDEGVSEFIQKWVESRN